MRAQSFDRTSEWVSFERAIKSPRPAIEVFTGQALMLIYLALGENALKADVTSTSLPAQPVESGGTP